MIILMTAATDMEMQEFINAEDYQKGTYRLITGVGPVETTLSLSGLLHKKPEIDCVINFGIAGAYPKNNASVQAGLLDLCLAEQEIFGDFGIQLADTIERFGGDLAVRDRFILDAQMVSGAGQILGARNIPYKQGCFVTVNCASGTQLRGEQLGRQFRGLCENMEGAAVARVCEEFSLPCLEVRCVSNMVEERKRENWLLEEACAKAGRAAATIAAGLA